MADEKSSGTWGSSFVVLAFAAVSAAYMTFQQPALVSTRPSEPEYQGHAIKAGQDIDARLWQDPFDAVARNIQAGADRTPRPGNPNLNDPYLRGSSKDLAIAVTLPGAPYPEIAETRRRLRYAVLAALHIRKFMPVDEKHIGYFRTDKPPFIEEAPHPGVAIFVEEKRRSENEIDGSISLEIDQKRFEPPILPGRTGTTEAKLADLPKTIPFEQFEEMPEKPGPVGPRVLLLWVDEDFLTSARTPIASLTRLHQVLAGEGYGQFIVLGPENSTTLAAMVKEIDGPQGEKSCRNGFSIYNFGATAEEGEILKFSHFSQINLKDLLCKAGLIYHKTINTDDQLAQTLACELMRRDPSLHLLEKNCKGAAPPDGNDPGNHIVLISDWDTVYGADLAATVKNTFDRSNNTFGKSNPAPVMVATYLRGLDGRLPNRRRAEQEVAPTNGDHSQQKSAEQPGEKPPSIATQENANRFARAEGQSQFDYLRRLAADLKARDLEFLRNEGGHIGAIGVLGSDVYDKLLILQALRLEFPGANFFTTDLDALLLPDKKSHYTRNLLVASSYGLKLDHGMEADIRDLFRNSYQTSIFVAAARAIDEIPGIRSADGCQINEATSSKPTEPLLFQIGRTGAQALPTAPIDAAPASSAGGCAEATNPPKGGPEALSPVRAADIGLVPASFSTSLAVFLIPLLIGLVFSSARVRKDCFAGIGPADQNWFPRWSGRIMAGLVSLGVLALWARLTFGWWSAAQWLTNNGLGEPISVFEGVSIWPAIALRAVGILLVLAFTWYAVHALEVNQRETLEKFNEWSGRERLRDAWGDLLKKEDKRWTAAIRAALWFHPLPQAVIDQHDDDPRDEKPLSEIVTTQLSSHWIVRCLRAGLATLVMVIIISAILRPLSDGETLVPARGDRAQSLFHWVTRCDFLATMFLTFLVADATIYSRSFIRRLTLISTQWPYSTIIKYRLRFHLIDEYDLRDRIDLQFLAERTSCITKLVYLPFVAWAVLIFSRSRLFDDFSMPWPLLLVYTAVLAIIVGAVIAYRSTAEKARRVACKHLSNRIIAAKGRGADARAEQLEKLLVQMQDLREGAFAPLTSQPAVKAVLLPLVTYGGAWLAHIYGLPGT
jgi:hypothetical protein